MIECEPVSVSRYGPLNSMDRLTRSFLEARDDLLRFLKRRGRRKRGRRYRAERLAQAPGARRSAVVAGAAGRPVHYRGSPGNRLYRREVAALKVSRVTRPRGRLPVRVLIPKRRQTPPRGWTISRGPRAIAVGLPRSLSVERLEELTHAEIAARLGIIHQNRAAPYRKALRLCVRVSD